jgi:uncharacterized membrane protein YccC
MIAASEPQVKEAAPMFLSRIVNVAAGCGVGLLFLVVGGSSEWKLPLALAIAVLISSYVIRIQTMWRQAPITAAIVIAAGLTHQSRLSGIEHGLHKVAEVIFGCLVGLAVSWGCRRSGPSRGPRQWQRPPPKALRGLVSVQNSSYSDSCAWPQSRKRIRDDGNNHGGRLGSSSCARAGQPRKAREWRLQPQGSGPERP